MAGSSGGRLSSAIKNPFFLLSAAAFILNQLAEANGLFIPFIHSYLDDFVCMPVILTLALVLYRFILFRKGVYRLSVFQIIITVIYFFAVFELLLPRYNPKYVSDYWDIIPYSLGALIFYFFTNPKPKKASISS